MADKHFWYDLTTKSVITDDNDTKATDRLGPYATREEAIEDQRLFAQLHADHWPEVTVVSTMRQISDGPDAPTE